MHVTFQTMTYDDLPLVPFVIQGLLFFVLELKNSFDTHNLFSLSCDMT